MPPALDQTSSKDDVESNKTPLAPEANTALSYNTLDEPEKPQSFIEKTTSQFFPMEPFKYCPCLEPIAYLIPGPVRKIYCVAQLMLVLGVICTCLMLLEIVLSLYSVGGCRDAYCRGKIFPIIFLGCCMSYFIRTVSQYDQDLVVKQKEIQKAKEKLNAQYDAIIAELETCVAKSMEQEASLAERSFESKRRDFQRFLKNITPQLKEAVSVGNFSERELLERFRTFIDLWLTMFAECSIDPMKRPFRVVKPEELQECKTAWEVAQVLGDKLKLAEIKFISKQQAKDKEELNNLKGKHKKKVQAQRESMQRRSSACLQLELPMEDAQGSQQSAERKWLHLGRAHSGKWQIDRDKAEEDGFPVEFHFVVGKCIFLSREHVALMIAIIAGVLILVVENVVMERYSTKYLFELETFICLICIAFVLSEFISIDVIQQLEFQLMELQVQQDKLEEKREKVKTFYDSIQQLAEMWLHRAVPRLELMHRISQELEDQAEQDCKDFLNVLTKVNEKVSALEASLPPLPLWLSEDYISNDNKKRLGDIINDLTRTATVKETLSKIEDASRTLANETQRLQPKAAVLPNEGTSFAT